MSKDFFDDMIPSELINYGELMVYDNQFVEPMEADLEKTKITVADNEGRIAALEAQIPGGGTGTGAYLNLGGTPDRYPFASECIGQGTDEMGFVVVAKPDGMYFYNPVTKQFIPPKKGGGNMAIHGQFPEVFDASHELHHAGRVTRSGIFFSEYDKVGVTAWTDPDKACQVMVTVHELGYEQHVVLGKEGLAYKLFKPGDNNADWVHYQGTPGGGGGGSTHDPIEFLTDLKDVPDNYAGMGGKIIAIKATEDGVEFIDAPAGGGGTPVPGKETFTELLDTPDNYAGHAGRAVIVNPGENGLTFADRDPDVGGRLLAGLKDGEYVVNSRGVTGSFLHATTSPDAIATAPHNVIRLSGGATVQATLPKVCPHDQDVMADHEVRAGAVIYVHNQSTAAKRVRVTTGDVFMKNEAETPNAQSIAAGCTALLYPAYEGGKGVWYILSQNTIMPQGGPKDRFLDLDDTPAAYTGNESKILSVTAAGDGLEFIDAPTGGGVTEAEVETMIQDILASGSNLVHMNGFGAAVSQSSNDRPSNIIALNPYIMMSGNTVKTATMSKIVAQNATTLAADEVRAGRVTYIINQSATHNKNVDVPSGHNFFIDGSTTTTRQIVPPLSCKIFFPGIWGNGNKNWAYIGGFSTVPGNVRETGLMDGSHRYNAKGLVRSSWSTSTATFTQANIVDSPIIAMIGTGNQTVNMPQLVEKDTAAPTISQMRCGQRVTLFNNSAANKTIVWHSGQGLMVNGSVVTTNYTLKPRYVEEFVGFKNGTAYTWICVSSQKTDGLPAGGISATDQEFLAGIQNGDKYLHANAMVTPASVIASTTFTAEQAATTNNLIIRPTTGSTTGTMPKIVSVTTTSIPTDSVRLGFEMTISNHGTTNVTLNYQNGSQGWNNGAFYATQTIAANSWLKVVAINTSGSTYGWAKVSSGTH